MTTSIKIVHSIAAKLAFSLISLFFISTLAVELFGDRQAILQVKTLIMYGVILLILSMAATGISGIKMAPRANKGPIGKKKKRMPLIALNGIVILIPCAVYLHHLASHDQFNNLFYFIQGIELIAGATNLALMSLNIRDARRLKTKQAD